jgi:hypothetical protein
MDGAKITAAWKEWLNSEEGQKASDPNTLTSTLSARTYLENRLERAFHAGMKAGATVVADEVIAAMEKEKHS